MLPSRPPMFKLMSNILNRVGRFGAYKLHFFFVFALNSAPLNQVPTIGTAQVRRPHRSRL